MITIAPHDPGWAPSFRPEAADLHRFAPSFLDIEHTGSAAIPGLAAKPVIDNLAAVNALDDLTPDLPALNQRGYAVVDVGMVNRHFLQRPGFNLHVVTLVSWPRRKERLLREALIADLKAPARYGALKHQLALTHGDDIAAYTTAKTAFVQEIMDQVHGRLGWPRENVGED